MCLHKHFLQKLASLVELARASTSASLLHTRFPWFRPYGYGWFEVREGQHQNLEPLFCARLDVPSHERRVVWPVPYRREFSGLSSPVHIPRHVYGVETPS